MFEVVAWGAWPPVAPSPLTTPLLLVHLRYLRLLFAEVKACVSTIACVEHGL